MAVLADMATDPFGAQAAGAACARNNVAVIVPCHRVIGSDGRLTGYGWGLPRKRWLLAHESAMPTLLDQDVVARGQPGPRPYPARKLG
jgi:O-6-methylguanine DNA methyltransferase